MNTPPEFGAMREEVAELVERAQAAEREGRRSVARGSYEKAIRMLARDEGALVPTLIRRIARSYIDDGMFDAALDCLAAAQHLSRARGDTSGIAHAMNLMAIANLRRGDLDTAELMYQKAHALAEAAADSRLEAMVAQNLGIIAGVRGDHETAFRFYAASLAGYRALGLDDYIGLVLNNIAMAHASQSHWAEAESSYTEALKHCAAAGDAVSRRMIEANLAEMWLARGAVEEAIVICDRLRLDAEATGDQRALGEVRKNLGVIARMEGRLSAAECHLAQAYTDAMAREDLLLAAECAREQAELFELAGRNRDTLRVLGQSHRLYSKLRADRHLADVAQRIERLETRFYDIVNRWADTIESKDPYTLGHCERVAEYACLLAREIGLEDITMFWFRIGALLHDVGKIEVPTEILTKNGPLTTEERAIVERHAAVGSDLLRDIEFPWDVLPMIRGHHERWDGSGYPDKLAGDRIPLTARVLCIADVFDALASDRPYRPAFPRDEALAIMQREVGRMFDPDLFPKFLGLVSRTGPSAPLMARV